LKLSRPSTQEDFLFLRDDVWWLRNSFLSDLFDTLNEVILSLQGTEENFITIMNKLKASQEKMTLGNSKVSKSIFGSFPTADSNPSKYQEAIANDTENINVFRDI
jgi:hypothetical protein